MAENDPVAERWPIDYDSLRQGDVLNRERLARIIGVRPGSHAYDGRLAEFQRILQEQLWSRGKQWTVRKDGGALVILEEGDVPKYVRKRQRNALRAFFKMHGHLLATDPSKMTVEERKDRDRQIVVSSRLIGGLVAVQPKIQRSVHRRNTPGLPRPGGG